MLWVIFLLLIYLSDSDVFELFIYSSCSVVSIVNKQFVIELYFCAKSSDGNIR